MLASLAQESSGMPRSRHLVDQGARVRQLRGGIPNATPAVMNGFSELILAVWGDAGRHARSAIGSGELPFGMPVEVEAIVALG